MSARTDWKSNTGAPNVLEIDVATRGSRIYAAGIRNPTGLGWEPQTGQLWAIANERDEIGADLVPDYLTSVRDGGFYGWPYSYYGQNVDQRVKDQRPDLVAKAIKPDYALGSHVAALGVWFSSNNALPEKYHNGAFVGEHGSWDRSPLSGYAVVFVPFKDGKPAGAPETLVSGFYSDDEKQLYGAPVGRDAGSGRRTAHRRRRGQRRLARDERSVVGFGRLMREHVVEEFHRRLRT